MGAPNPSRSPAGSRRPAWLPRPGRRSSALALLVLLVGTVAGWLAGSQPVRARSAEATGDSAGFAGEAVAVAASAPAAASPQAPGDWPMYQHDPAHTGRTSATITNSGPLYVQWAYSFGERVEVEVQPVLADGVLYVGVMNGEMNAINANTGTMLWRVLPGGPIAHTAAVADGRVIYGSLDGAVYALSTSNGAQAWKYQTGGPVLSAPAVVNGKVYIGSNDGHLYALNAANGNLLWSFQAGGPVVSSPAVANGRVYFGAEDLYARAVNADSGALLWQTRVYGAAMHNTHPVVSDDGQVVIFQTAKAGLTGYIPVEGYPDVPVSANPVQTWNTYYQQHPTYRTLYYLNASNGADLWDPAQLRYVPMPIPYWGLLSPVLHPDGSAWFPAPAGSDDHQFVLNHDNRLLSINLSSGVTTQRAGGSDPAFQHRSDESGRAVFSGNDYYTTISEDVGVFRPASGSKSALFTNGNPGGYNFGSHMDPHSPLPSRHLWRYGGVIAIGGMPGASVPIIANNRLYFISYGWLYALGTQNQGVNPATDFPSLDRRLEELTYPRSHVPTLSEIRAEIDQRVADIIALGPENPPMAVRWEQADSDNVGMLNNEFRLEVYGYEADLVRTLAEAYPHLSSSRQAELRAYLAALVDRTLLVERFYTNSVIQCLVFSEPGIQEGNPTCYQQGDVIARWSSRNPNLLGMRLYALWAYADATGDWARLQSHWSMIWQAFDRHFLDEGFCLPSPMGFCMYEDWRAGRLNIGAQIETAQALRDMAAHLGQSSAQAQAQQFLDRVLDARLAMAEFVPSLYSSGQRPVALIRLNSEIPNCDPCDDRIYHPDMFGDTSPYNLELVPYRAERRDATNDPSQLNWWYSSSDWQVEASIGFMYYQALSGAYPISESLANLLHDHLYDAVSNYVKSYEVNAPWWWMADLAHHTTAGGEHIYHSPTLSWTMFQVKAWVLRENWNTLAAQLPEPTSFNARYDLYRLQNLATLLSIPGTPDQPDFSNSTMMVSDASPSNGDVIRYTLTVRNNGTPTSSPAQLTDTLPQGLSYISDSLDAPGCGTVNDANAPVLAWQGNLSSGAACTIVFDALVQATSAQPIYNSAAVSANGLPAYSFGITIVPNAIQTYLPLIQR